MNATAEAPAVAQVLELEPQPSRPLAAQPITAPQARTMTPGDLLLIAQQQTPDDLDRLERLMVMHERWLTAERAREADDRARHGELAFRRAFAAFKGENIIIPKTLEVKQRKRDGGEGPHFFQAEFDEVCRRLAPALSKHGFGFRHDQKFTSKVWPIAENPNNTIPWVIVTCLLIHAEGHTDELVLEGPDWEGGSMNSLQRMQASASYMKRQSLLAITGTPTGGEDDERGMRKTGAADDTADEAALQLVDEGEAQAKTGLAALTKWWGGLNAKDRNQLSPSFKGWRATAVRVDQQRGAS